MEQWLAWCDGNLSLQTRNSTSIRQGDRRAVQPLRPEITLSDRSMVPGCLDKALTSRFAHLPPVVPNNEIGVCRPPVCPPNEGSVPLQIPGQSRLSVSTPSFRRCPSKRPMSLRS